jgi:hypothetical protein
VRARRPPASKLFRQVFPNFCLFSPNFRKHFFGGFERFQRVKRPKKAFFDDGAFSKFLNPPDSIGAPVSKWEFRFARSRNEAKTKRNRFASEIACFAKSLISLDPKVAGFRGFQ